MASARRNDSQAILEATGAARSNVVDLRLRWVLGRGCKRNGQMKLEMKDTKETCTSQEYRRSVIIQNARDFHGLLSERCGICSLPSEEELIQISDNF
jgi:hypothetical protein